MAEPLKNQYGTDVPQKIAGMIAAQHPRFPSAAFLKDALNGYDALELMPRARHITRALRQHLPADYAKAVEILLASMGPKLGETENLGMGVFMYLPHVFFVAEYGLDHFELSMRANYELTQRFTAEFSIRPYLMRHPEKTLARLEQWTQDKSPHVRRLVSEGTRPRLPWAPRLPAFQKDPRPVLKLLELLKDDHELYVRRSVANNLNDIGKDNPDLLVKTARRWMKGASENRAWLVKHGLRTAVKRGEMGALKILGFEESTTAKVRNVSITPKRARAGGEVTVAFDVVNTASKPQRILVDFRIHFVKANGKTGAKVFKLKSLDLGPKESTRVGKKVSLAEMTTRKHYAGEHKVDALINGRTVQLGKFHLAG